MRAERPTVPLMAGFDFLKTLAGQAGKGIEGLNQLNTLGQGLGAGLGGFKQWVAPTLDPDELDKRIEELRTVQFWLEQNARLLGATIQALEVQKMTLSTLRTMNVKMPDLQQVLGAMVPPAPAEPTPSKSPETQNPEPKSKPAKGGEPAAGLVDPMKWWGALTEQFQQLATQALAAAPGAAATAGAAAAKATGHSATPGAAAKRASSGQATGSAAGAKPRRTSKPPAADSKTKAQASTRRKT